VESSGKIFDIKEVVVDAFFLDECTLSIGNEIVHERGKANGKHLGDNTCNRMDEANWVKVRDLLRTILLGQ
jgi:hypothetical protein